MCSTRLEARDPAGLLGQTCTMQNHRKRQPPPLVMHTTSQISCRALSRAHPFSKRKCSLDRSAWVNLPGHLLTGICKGLANNAPRRHKLRICSLPSPNQALSQAAERCIEGTAVDTALGAGLADVI